MKDWQRLTIITVALAALAGIEALAAPIYKSMDIVRQSGQQGATGATGPASDWTAGTNGLYYNGDGVIVGPDAAFCAADGGPGDLHVEDDLEITGGSFWYCAALTMLSDTTDGADNMTLSLNGGGGGASSTRGSFLVLSGNESGTNGHFQLRAGGHANSYGIVDTAGVNAGAGGPLTLRAVDAATDTALKLDVGGFSFTGAATDLLTVGSGVESYFNDWLGIGGLTAGASACIDNDGADRLYHDTDCDGVKDGGEEYIDQPASGLWEDGTNGVYEDDKAVIVGTDVAFDAQFGTGGVGDLRVQDDMEIAGGVLGFSAAGTNSIVNLTADGADSQLLLLGHDTNARGGTVSIYGNDRGDGTSGDLYLESGAAAASGVLVAAYPTDDAGGVALLHDGPTNQTLLVWNNGFSFTTDSTGKTLTTGAGIVSYFNDYIGIGDDAITNAACIDNDGADRLYHDTDCDGTKDAGEQFLDLLGSTDVAVLMTSATCNACAAGQTEVLADVTTAKQTRRKFDSTGYVQGRVQVVLTTAATTADYIVQCDTDSAFGSATDAFQVDNPTTDLSVGTWTALSGECLNADVFWRTTTKNGNGVEAPVATAIVMQFR